jgi:hypothetical protein
VLGKDGSWGSGGVWVGIEGEHEGKVGENCKTAEVCCYLKVGVGFALDGSLYGPVRKNVE